METYVKNEKIIDNFIVQAVLLNATAEKAFEYIANPSNLPEWTGAFKKADQSTALMETSKGQISIGLKTKANREAGSIDWYMTMPDGFVGAAYSRIVPCNGGKRCIYSFTLLAPPVPLEELEGTLSEQSGILAHELRKLSSILYAKD